MHRVSLRARVVSMAVLLLSVSVGRSETLTFDDLTDPNGYGTPIANYGGLTWDGGFGFYVLNTSSFYSAHGASGYSNGTVSGTNVAYGIDTSITSATAFAFDSGYFTAAWNNGLSIDITGYLNNVQVDQATITVNATGPTLETFDWGDVDAVDFISSGGTSAGYLYGLNNPTFVIDNLTIGPAVVAAPLPSTAYPGLALLGILGCWMLARRRKAATR